MAKQRPNGHQAAGRAIDAWLSHYDRSELDRQAEDLAVGRDMVTLLTYVQDNKVTGTKSTGNLPLKAIREVTAGFVNPPKLDVTIGEKMYKLRTEADVWPLHYLHILADVGELVNARPGSQWKLTRHGKKYLDLDPLSQVVHLFRIWWSTVNWVVAYPVEGIGEELPPYFNVATLIHLQETCRVGQMVSFDAFADELIEKTGLIWGSGQSDYARGGLHGAISAMIINMLVKYGAANTQDRESSFGISKLDKFEITQFGEALLRSVAATIM